MKQKKTQHTVFLADDHTLVREGLKLLIESDPAFTVTGECSNGPDTIRLCRELVPDIAIIDIAMPGISGLDVVDEIMRSPGSTRIVMISFQALPEQIIRARRSGATGFVLKDATGRELLSAMHAVIGGKTFFSQGVASCILQQLMESNKSPSCGCTDSPSLTALSLRERQVLQMLAEGKKNSLIAELLHLSDLPHLFQ
jgi:DNA-binding NarL/FixJ family response regulator